MRLIQIAKVGHLRVGVLLRRDPRHALLRRHAAAARRARLARSRPLPVRQGPRGGRALSAARRTGTSSSKDVLDEYTRLGNPLGDHPDMSRVPGIDFSSGSLGHALSAGLGMALGGRLQGRDFSVFVLLGDGELHEGQVWEAAMSAAHHQRAQPDRDRRPERVLARRQGGRRDRHRAARRQVARVRLGDARGRRPRRARRCSALLRGLVADDETRRRPAVVDRAHGQGQGRVVHGDRARLASRLPRPRRRGARARRDPGRRHDGDRRCTRARGTCTRCSTSRRASARSPTRSADLVDEGHPVVACTADLKYSNGLFRFQERHPERFLQFGISEQNMVSAAAGLATTGRASLRRDVRVVPRAALLRADPHRRRLSRPAGAADRSPLAASRSASTARRTTRPRTSRSCGRSRASPSSLPPTGRSSPRRCARRQTTPVRSTSASHAGATPRSTTRRHDFELGRAIAHGSGADLTILATGSTVHPALAAAAERSATTACSVGVLDVHTIKPLDAAAVLAAAATLTDR